MAEPFSVAGTSFIFYALSVVLGDRVSLDGRDFLCCGFIWGVGVNLGGGDILGSGAVFSGGDIFYFLCFISSFG